MKPYDGKKLDDWVTILYRRYALSIAHGPDTMFPDFLDADGPLRFEYVVHELSHGVTLEPDFDLWPFNQEFPLSRWIERRIGRMRARERPRAEARAIAVELRVFDKLGVPYNRSGLMHYAAQGARVSPKRLGGMVGAHVRTGAHEDQAAEVVRMLKRECGRMPRVG